MDYLKISDIPYRPFGRWYTLNNELLVKRITNFFYEDKLKVGETLIDSSDLLSSEYLDELLVNNHLIKYYEYNPDKKYLIIDNVYEKSPFFGEDLDIGFKFLDKNKKEWEIVNVISKKIGEPSLYVVTNNNINAVLKILEFDKDIRDGLPLNYGYLEPGITAYFRSKYSWVVDVYDWINDYYLLMEMVDRTAENEDRSIVKNIGLQMIDILEDIHDNGFFHQDIKPENIGLVGDKVKLFDLDLVKSNLIQFDEISDNRDQVLISPLFHTNEPKVLELYNQINNTNHELYDYSDYPEPVTFGKIMDIELLMLSLIFMYNPELFELAKNRNPKEISYGDFLVELAKRSPKWLYEAYMETLFDRAKLLVYNKANVKYGSKTFYRGFYFKRDYVDYNKYRKLLSS